MPRDGGPAAAGFHGPCCHAARCRERGCSVRLPASGWCVCLRGSDYQRKHGWDGPLCDCLILWSHEQETVAGAVELKSGAVDASEAIRQLQAGADVLAELAASMPVTTFVPVVVHGRRIRAIDMRAIAAHAITFRGKRWPISVEPCGKPFVEIVWSQDGSQAQRPVARSRRMPGRRQRQR